MQTFSILATLLLAAVGTHAAPALESRQTDSVPLNIYNGDACQGAVVTTAFVPKDGSCFGFSPIVSGQTDSARIDVVGSLPTGCTLTIFNTADCSSQGNNVPVPVTGRCSTFGTGNPLDRFIRAARLTGTCA